ncbi:MAG TPA: hydroxymethylbilane synthase [Bryobacteraceae bacterium]|jgi:hydroxymethylbilane synthase|nr:hydroxymethylbilane synthase [Bryobacteraceae bacterium]
MTLVIGSRGSQLARWQADHIASRLLAIGVETRIEIIRTSGDRLQNVSLVQAGGKGLFTKEIEEALQQRAIDLAVHSLKDLPTEHPPGLVLAAIPEREDPRDALVGCPLDELPHAARVGTSSNRRRAQMLLLRPDLIVEPVRGNVDTRLRKLHSGEFNAILLAAAGLRRLNLEKEIAHLFTPEEICPAPGQGALAVQTREGDRAFEICRKLDHEPTSAAVRCERALLTALGGGCQLPIGAYAEIDGETLTLLAGVFSPDGGRHLKVSVAGLQTLPEELGYEAAERLLADGAGTLLGSAAS